MYVIFETELENIRSKEYKKISFFAFIFLNLYNSVAIFYKLFKSGVAMLDTITEGTVSQIFYLGPSSCFMLFRK